jgi:hypothetical protein
VRTKLLPSGKESSISVKACDTAVVAIGDEKAVLSIEGQHILSLWFFADPRKGWGMTNQLERPANLRDQKSDLFATGIW